MAAPAPATGWLGWLRGYERADLAAPPRLRDALRARGSGALALCPPSRRAVVERSPLGKALGRERMFFDQEHAVGAFQRR